ncbi:MAG TPA: 30S ribosomal protein S20 [Rhodospirillaceae bacterium]|nr:30S ribosomal protein S20 [Rhodospirillaceae bacterium]HAT34449.1 30S ribosomal protein S20 [Rhodospirillaceae bacterium]|tara:strand:- start:515 stop:778 length:264 start_codon:yes stop_codon:yes gene_type:complete
MAHTVSARKRVRQAERRNQRNRARVSRIRTHLRKVEEAIDSGDKDAAAAAFKAAMPELHRGVSKGVLRKNTVSRKLSRLNKRIRALA